MLTLSVFPRQISIFESFSRTFKNSFKNEVFLRRTGEWPVCQLNCTTPYIWFPKDYSTSHPTSCPIARSLPLIPADFHCLDAGHSNQVSYLPASEVPYSLDSVPKVHPIHPHLITYPTAGPLSPTPVDFHCSDADNDQVSDMPATWTTPLPRLSQRPIPLSPILPHHCSLLLLAPSPNSAE